MLAQVVLSFAIGIAAILISSRIFLRLAEEFSARLKLSPLFVAVVIVAFCTTLPELTVTIASIAQNEPGLALGNVVGSSVTNLALIFGLTTLFRTIRVGTKKTQITGMILAAVVAFFVLLQLVALKAEVKALLLLLTLGIALLYEYVLALNGRLHEDKSFLKLLAKKRAKPKFTGIIAVVAVVLCVTGLGVGGMITVRAIDQLSALLSISTTLLGLGINSLATTLPELSMAIAASSKKENKIVIGTLVGSNIFNLTLFPALIYFFTGFSQFPLLQLGALFAVTVIFVSLLFLFRGKVIPLAASLTLLACYGLFMYANFYLTR